MFTIEILNCALRQNGRRAGWAKIIHANGGWSLYRFWADGREYSAWEWEPRAEGYTPDHDWRETKPECYPLGRWTRDQTFPPNLNLLAQVQAAIAATDLDPLGEVNNDEAQRRAGSSCLPQCCGYWGVM